MKKIIPIVVVSLLAFASCKKALDINTDPNVATSATPELILPQALVGTANNLNGFNSYGAQLTGYSANAGGYGGFGTSISYNFSSSDFSGRWATTYDNLEDYQYIINKTTGNATYSYFLGVARVMKVLGFQLLVDAYNDVPYSEALKGSEILTPKYDDAKVIYKSLATELDSAIVNFTTGAATAGVTPLGTSDVMFGGNITKWKQFANTLKLRLLVRARGKVTFANSSFSADGFLTSDALINPGFKRDNGRQSPKWNSWGFGYTGSDANKAWIPTKFIVSFYDGTKLLDSARGASIYYKWPTPGTNRLGVENTTVPSCPSGSFWYNGANRAGASAGGTNGPLKGPTFGYPVITAAEAYFLRAEAGLVGITTEDPATMFNNGIKASMTFQMTKEDGTLTGDATAELAKYLTLNNGSYLANYAMAVTPDQKLEAIITQKYVALNFVNSEEAWNEYRRTAYPFNNPSGADYATFSSKVSESTRPDKLPSRILYPPTEGSYNATNMPKGISPFTSLIFWAK